MNWRICHKLLADILLVVTLAGSLAGVLVADWLFWYRGGWSIVGQIDLLRFICVCLAILVTVAAFHVAIGVRVVLGLFSKSIWLAAVRFWLFCLALSLTCLSFCLLQPGYIPFTQGFRDRIARDVDVIAIRRWLVETSSPGQVPPEQWPPEIKAISPVEAIVEEPLERGRCIRMRWGGGFGYWGLVIGASESSLPRTEDWEYVVPVEAGVYVWHEIQ